MLILYFALMKLLIFKEVQASINVNQQKIVSKKGEEIDLICSADSEALGCSFKVRISDSNNIEILFGDTMPKMLIRQIFNKQH